MELPQEYVVQKFLEYGYGAHQDSHSSNFNCCCPICQEGTSFTKKKRCYYIPQKNLIYCHNCGWSSTPLTWIMRVGGMSREEVIAESGNVDYIPKCAVRGEAIINAVVKKNVPTLPNDCVNLFDPIQMRFYSDNSVIQKALRYVKERRLDSAVNRPNALYVPLGEGGHKGRLVIPFCSFDGDIEYYQSRAFGGSFNDAFEKIKYLSKKDCSKTIFGLDKVDDDIENVYILEGPIDAFFVKNGIATAGITLKGDMFCETQKPQINALRFGHEFIWVLDNQWVDDAARKRTVYLLERGEKVFFWPKDLSAFKDVNDFCTHFNLDEFPRDLIDRNVIEGESAKLSFLMKIRFGMKQFS